MSTATTRSYEETRPTPEWNVPEGIESSPSAKIRYRLGAPLRLWQDSIARQVVEECCKFPLRIAELLAGGRLSRRIAPGTVPHFIGTKSVGSSCAVS